MPLIAEVAKTCPLLPTERTIIDAETTIRSKQYLILNHNNEEIFCPCDKH